MNREVDKVLGVVHELNYLMLVRRSTRIIPCDIARWLNHYSIHYIVVCGLNYWTLDKVLGLHYAA